MYQGEGGSVPSLPTQRCYPQHTAQRNLLPNRTYRPGPRTCLLPTPTLFSLDRRGN